MPDDESGREASVISDHPSNLRPLPWLLRQFLIRLGGAFIAMFLLAYLEATAGGPCQRFGPLVDPLFGDLLEYRSTFHALHTPSFFLDPHTPRIAYPPFGALLFLPLYVSGHPVLVYLTLALLWSGGCLWTIRRALLSQAVRPGPASLFPLLLALASFPLTGLLQRGNIELFVWILATSGIYAFVSGKSLVAATLWGLAAATKLYPLLYLLLLLPRRDYRAALCGAGTFLACTGLALAFLGPDLHTAWTGSLHSIVGYQGLRAAEWSAHDLSMNHSLFLLVKLAAFHTHRSTAAAMLPYLLTAALLFATLFFTRLRRMPEANQILAISIATVALPPVSYFYTLVHLYAPFVLLALLAVKAKPTIPGLSISIQLFVPLFASFTLFTFRKIDVYGGPIQGLCLLALFVCALRFPFTEDAPAE